MLGTAFIVAAFLDNGTPLPVMMVIFALAGIGWATINVNSFPMVVELARGGNVGKYTGFYYTASMAAQTLTHNGDRAQYHASYHVMYVVSFHL